MSHQDENTAGDTDDDTDYSTDYSPGDTDYSTGDGLAHAERLWFELILFCPRTRGLKRLDVALLLDLLASAAAVQDHLTPYALDCCITVNFHVMVRAVGSMPEPRDLSYVGIANFIAANRSWLLDPVPTLYQDATRAAILIGRAWIANLESLAVNHGSATADPNDTIGLLRYAGLIETRLGRGGIQESLAIIIDARHVIDDMYRRGVSVTNAIDVVSELWEEGTPKFD